MKGGPEPPCENDRLLERIRTAARERGELQQCPRVDLERENQVAAGLLALVTDRELGHVSGVFLERMTEDLEPRQLEALLGRVAAALHDTEANAARFPKPPPPPPALSRRRPTR